MTDMRCPGCGAEMHLIEVAPDKPSRRSRVLISNALLERSASASTLRSDRLAPRFGRHRGRGAHRLARGQTDGECLLWQRTLRPRSLRPAMTIARWQIVLLEVRRLKQ